MALLKTFEDGELLTASDINTYLNPEVPTNATVYDTGWVDLSLEANWSNYGSSFAPAQVRRIGKVVHFRAMLRTAITRNTDTVLITTIPPDFRPAFHVMLNGVASVSTQNTGGASAGTAHTHSLATTNASYRIQVTSSNGFVSGFFGSTSGVLSSNGWITIEGNWVID